MPIEKSVGAVVFRREKNKILYLLIQHPENEGYHGHWDFPKGHVEKGEAWEDTLRREVKEETGIRKLEIIPDFYTWYKYFYRARGNEKKERKISKKGINIFKIVTIYLVEAKEKKVKLSFEHISFAWLEYKEALKRITYENPRKALKEANVYLKKYFKK
jgi:bis(5'-nucleosidyl)-tetraphosphatase